jgi:hypothetical protein
MNYKDKHGVKWNTKDPIVYEKSFVVYSYDEDLTIEDINKVLKDMNVSARELTDDEVIYQI